MARVRPLPDGRFVVDVKVDGTRRRYRCATEAEALALGARLEDGASCALRPRMNLAELCDEMVATKWKGRAGAGVEAKHAHEAIKFFQAKKLLRNITPAQLDHYAHKLERKKLSPATVNRYLSTLSSMLTHALRKGWLEQMPAMPRRTEHIAPLAVLTPENEAALLSNLRANMAHAVADLVVFMVDTGARLTEALYFERLDWDEPQIRLSAYNRSQLGHYYRFVPASPRVKEILSRWPTCSARFPLTSSRVHSAWDRAAIALGLDSDRGLRVLRRTYAARMRETGVSEAVVRDRLGTGGSAQLLRSTEVDLTAFARAVAWRPGDPDDFKPPAPLPQCAYTEFERFRGEFEDALRGKWLSEPDSDLLLSGFDRAWQTATSTSDLTRAVMELMRMADERAGSWRYDFADA